MAVSMDALPPALVLHALKFLAPRDLAAIASCARTLRAAALDESVWRDMCVRTLGVSAGFVPGTGAGGAGAAPSFSAGEGGLTLATWRSEYRWRMDARRSERGYQRALTLGMAGRRMPVTRMAGQLFDVYSPGAASEHVVVAAAPGAGAGATAQQSGGAAPGTSGPLDSEPHSSEAGYLVAKGTSRTVGVRQGNATWSALQAPP
jgi:hypothetical protein